MATAQTITADNYDTLLVRSDNPRGANPNGNIYFNESSPFYVQIITAEELPNINLGGGLEANPLTNDLKIDMLALSFFAYDSFAADADLQAFRLAIDPVANRMGRYVGANSLLNGIKLNDANGSLSDERFKISNSGVTEFAAAGDGRSIIDRVYHGAKTTGLAADCQPFYMLVDSLSEADRLAAEPIDFSKLGDINELIQTFGTTANGDASAGNFDSRTKTLILGVRHFGFTVAEVNSDSAGVSELGAYSNPYGLSHAPVLELAGINAADVYGGAAVSPFNNITFERRSSALVVAGFTSGSGNFTDVINNPDGASLIQLRAWADRAMQQDTDINTNTANTGAFRPKRVAPLYTVNAQGKVVWRKGLYVEVPIADQQDTLYTDDSEAVRAWPFLAGRTVSLTATWFNDPSPYFRLMYVDGAAGADFETENAVVVRDSTGLDLAGDESDARITPDGAKYRLSFGYNYDTDDDAGLTAGTDKEMVILVGGVNCKQVATYFTMTRTANIPLSAECEPESNR